VNNASWTPLGRGDGYEYSVTVLSVFWPRAEHAKLVARWPYFAVQVGRT
jgi:hypothetical protein